MHKAQHGQKLSVVRKVVTTLNFLTTPSFSVTTLSYKPTEYASVATFNLSDRMHRICQIYAHLPLQDPIANVHRHENISR